MPHLTSGFDNGRPLIWVRVGLTNARIQALQEAGQTVPPDMNARFLIDTGASHTVVDVTVVENLKLQAVGSTPIHSSTTRKEPEEQPLYDVSLLFEHSAHNRSFPQVKIIAVDLSAQHVQGLLGRDILKECLLVYDGQNQTFALAF